MASAARGQVRGLVGFLLLLFALRLLLLLAALDPEGERVMAVLDPAGLSWSAGSDRPLYDREELYAGTAAEAIRHDLGLPLRAYRYMAFSSGSLLVALAAVPLYELFGPHYIIFKILPLLVTLLGGLFWFLIVRLWLGTRPSFLFGLLYIFAPPVLSRTTLIAWGSHAEGMAVLGAVLYLGTRAVLAPDDRTRHRWSAGAGLLLGLSLLLTYSVVPVATAIGIAAILLTRLRPRRTWIAAGAGFGVGLLPWLGTIRETGGFALRVYTIDVGTSAGTQMILEKARLLLNRGLMAGYDLPGGMEIRAFAALTWLAVVVAGWVILARRWRAAFAVLVLAGSLGHLLAFLLAAPDASSRYLLPAYPLFLIAVIGLVVSRPAPGAATPQRRGEEDATPVTRQPLPRWRVVALAIVIAFGLISQAWVVSGSDFCALRVPLKGYDWHLMGQLMGWKVRTEWISKLPVATRPYFWVGFGKRVYHQMESSEWQAAAALAEQEADRVWEGIGMACREAGHAAQAGRHLQTLSGSARGAFRSGLMHFGEVIFSRLAARGDHAGVGAFLQSFEPVDQPELRLCLARTLGVMTTQGSGHEPTLRRIALDYLTAAERLHACGWSSYRGQGPAGELLWWRAPANAWTTGAGLPRPLSESRDFWEGVAAAYEWHLGTRVTGWILGDARGPRRLSQNLASVTHGLIQDHAAVFYRAAGRAAARALREPYQRAVADPAAWVWREAIPVRYHADFAAGLEERAGS